MYGEATATQQVQPGRWRLSRDSMERIGQPGVLVTVAPCSIALARDGEAVPRGRQRTFDRDAGAPQAPGLDVQRHNTASQAGIAGCRSDLRDGEGSTAEPRELVRADLADARQTGRVRRGNCGRVCAQCVSENAALTPRDGVEATPIAPRDGIETPSATPPDGAMKAIFGAFSTPPDGDPLEMPSLPVIQAKEMQQ